MDSGNPAASVTFSQLLVTVNDHQVLMTVEVCVRATQHKQRNTVTSLVSSFIFSCFPHEMCEEKQEKQGPPRQPTVQQRVHLDDILPVHDDSSKTRGDWKICPKSYS